MPNPTLAQIAQSVGVSKMTVSRALRGERHVKPNLAERIRQAASHLGYVPDPEVARLMTHLRQARAIQARQTLAFVWSEPSPLRTRTPWSRMLVSGATERAAELGYNLESFELLPGGMTAIRLAEILEHRGIRGLVIAPLLSRSRGHLRLPWEKFSTVVIGLGLSSPALHRVHHHHFLGMLTALRQLRKAGFKRIAFCASSVLDRRMFGAWSASFLVHHPLGAATAASLLHLPREVQRSAFLKWCELTRPDAVLDSGSTLAPWVQSLPPAFRPHLATLSWSQEHPNLPGLDQRPASLGHAAIDLLAAQLHQNERGIPACAKTLMLEGLWQPASSCPTPHSIPFKTSPAPPMLACSKSQ
jgi:transcriptional regulator with XRE-family HTH domain